MHHPLWLVRNLVWRGLLLALLALAGCHEAADATGEQPSSSAGADADGGSGLPGGSSNLGPDGQAGSAGQSGGAGQRRDDTPQSFESTFSLGGIAGGVVGGVGGGAAGAFGGVAGGGTLGGGQNGTPGGGDGSAGGAERAIAEADIVQVEGDRLYALSRVAGLSVVDVAQPAQLRLLGRYRALPGTPFEMYLRGSTAIVMFSSWGQYQKQSDGSFRFVQTSKVVALDFADAAAIRQLGSFDVAGTISDSRLVGDVLYVVGYQDGTCWGCQQNQPLTSVLSLDVRDPRAIRRVDELQFPGNPESFGGVPRSVSIGAQRLYIAGPEHGLSEPSSSTIQVVDISDPAGDLVQGAQLGVAGEISSRWQIDEFEGVLRVVSQPWQRASSVAPSVQTFSVVSSHELRALGSVTMQIPQNERLQSVRFDGTRGYAITALRGDPLFTLDLSDPARPRRLGELEMPGWIYHLEPRGNRVFGLGFDEGNPQGGITVSIIDVSNLASPRMLSRVNFGGSWATLPEDQDRIHKAFEILDALGLILVPFKGSRGWDPRSTCAPRQRSGVQLVDLAGDKLTTRGLAPARGDARRALVHGGALLAIADEAIDAFDITDRGAPVALGQLTLARNVSHVLPLANGHAARVNQDWYTRKSSIDIAALGSIDRADVSSGELDLSSALENAVTSLDGCVHSAWIEDAHASGTVLDVSFTRVTSSTDAYATRSGLLVVDAADPARPSVMAQLEWPTESAATSDTAGPWHPFSLGNNARYGYEGAQTSALRTQRALVLLEQRYRYQVNLGFQGYDFRLQVIDLTDPRAPHLSTLALPSAEGYGGLVADGDNVLLSHFEPTSAASSARFYVDRVDLSDPRQPKLSDKINVPGALQHFDRALGRAITSDLTTEQMMGLSADECYARYAHASFGSLRVNDSAPLVDVCFVDVQRLQLVRFVPGGAVLDDTHALDARERMAASSLGDGRLVVVVGLGPASPAFTGVPTECFAPPCTFYTHGSEPAELLVLGGLASGRFESGRLDVGNGSWWGVYGVAPPVYARGTSALLQSQDELAIVDTSSAGAPRLLRSLPLFGRPQRFSPSADGVLFALGTNGVQRVEF